MDPQHRHRHIGATGFARALLVLVTGTALAHLVTALALPVLSRLYAPADFGLLSVFQGLVAIGSVAACLRFDVAVPLPESEGHAFVLVTLSLISAAAVSLAAAVAILPAPGLWATTLGQSDLANLLGLLPLAMLGTAGLLAVQAWHIRRKAFKSIARARVGQSVAIAAVQIGSGFAAAGPVGLLAGYAAGAFVGVLALLPRLTRDRRTLDIDWPDRNSLGQVARAYARFPRYSTWEALANTAAIHVPVLIIAAITSTSEAGFLALAVFVIQAPMALVGAAAGQVFLSQAPAEHRAGRLGEFTAGVLRGLLRNGVGPLVAVGIASPFVFEWVFGPGWSRAGWLVAWMTPWFIAQFVASPLSMALHVTGRQRAAMYMQIFALAFRTIAILFAWAVSSDVVSEVYAVSGVVVYAIYTAIVLRAAGVRAESVLRGWRRTLMVCLAWAVAGIAGAAGVDFLATWWIR